MRIAVRTNRGTAALFSLLEALEARTLMAAAVDTFEKASIIAMTGKGKDGSGAGPQSLVAAPNGIDFYGTTVTGGPKGYGTVFKITGTEHTLTTVAWFTGKNGMGLAPTGQLVVDGAGNLFGITTGGGANNRGTLWEITAGDLAATHSSTETTSIITTLINFGGANGSYPLSGVTVDSSGNLFGTTVGVKVSGGKDLGVVFEVAPNGTNSHLDTISTFPKDVFVGGQITVDPSDGTIYGVTRNGGKNGDGSLFRIPPGTGSRNIETLVSFGMSAGKSIGTTPNCTLVVDSGFLYGTTSKGGANNAGTVFKYDLTPGLPSAQAFTSLVSFNGTNGGRPLGSLILDGSGNLFGVTALGGKSGVGTLFEAMNVTGSQSTITRLFSFEDKSTGTNPTGQLVLNSSGHFFVTTFSGGKNEKGAVLELQPKLIPPG